MPDDIPPGLDRHVLPIRAPQASNGPSGRSGGNVDEVLDSDGFLQPAPSSSWWAPPPVTPRPVTELIGSPTSFVLLAPGGVGKSTVLRELRQREPGAVDVDLTVHDKRGMSQALISAIADGGPVYLDALDVALRDVDAAFRILARELAVPEARQVRWRLACRPAVWSASLAHALRDALPDFEELTLLPLSRAAAASLAARVGAPGFLDAVVDAKLGRLAASALRMESAAEQWRRTGRLPESDLDAVEYEIKHLLVETSEDVRKTLSEGRRLRIAMRLGAMSIFSGITRFANHAQPAEPGRAHLDSLPSEPEPDQPGTHLGRNEWAEVIDSPLFVAAPAASATFFHQQYAEYLAAKYITTRRITRAQVRDLLVVSEEGLVPGALAGVLAWLAALDPQLVDDLVQANAMALAQTGVEIASDALRARVTAALLDQAADGDIDLDWGLDLRGLGYSGMEEALHLRLVAGVTRAEELVWVSWLAEAGRCAGLAEPLLAEALNSPHAAWARRAAAVACGALADDSVLARLAPLLRLDADEDPDDELLAAAVDALYPRLIGVTELVDVLRPRRNPDLVGAYLVLLGQLADRVAPKDLAQVIAWAAGQVAAGEYAYGRLIPQLLVRGWEHAGMPGVLDALAELLSAVVGHQGWRWPDYAESPPWQHGAGERCRLAVLVADRLEGQHSYELVDDLALITNGDFEWLMAELPRLPGKARTVLAECVPYLIREPSAWQADVILTLPSNHPAYVGTEYLRATVSLDSEHAQRSQRARKWELDSEVERATSREKLRERLTEALEAAEVDLTEWWKVPYTLAGKRNAYPTPTLTHDLTKRSGWALLTPNERRRVVDIGAQYVVAHEVRLPAGHWVGKVTDTEVLPDWSGVYLLTTLTLHEPDIVRSLESRVWVNWAPAIVSAWNSDTDAEDARLRCDLIDLAPPEARPHLASAAIARLDAYQEHHSSFTGREIFEHLISEIATTVGDRIATGIYDGDLADGLLRLLIAEAPEVARTTCTRIRARNLPAALTQLARRGQAQLDPDAMVDELVVGNADAEDLIATIPSLAILDLDDRRLSHLARLLLDRFPYEEDSPWTPEEHGPSGARRVRTAVLEELAARGATPTLVDLRVRRPALDNTVIGHYLRDSRKQAANLAFSHVEPDDLLTLLGHADARLVRCDADLLRVVIENLRELQHEIRASYRDVWNCIDGKWVPQSEDDISDWVQRALRRHLTTGSIVGREVQVNRPGRGGIGTRIDLAATSVTATQPISTAQVIIEAKVVNHGKLMTAMVDQLVQQYLGPTRVNHGIYLVYWVSPAQRPSTWTRRDRDDRDALLSTLERQASDLGPNVTIKPFLLDISRPD